MIAGKQKNKNLYESLLGRTGTSRVPVVPFTQDPTGYAEVFRAANPCNVILLDP